MILHIYSIFQEGLLMKMKTVLTIAGSDSSGGAGIQADIKTMTAHKVFATSVITAITAQNTIGVDDVLDVGAEFVGKQMDCVFRDIFPDAVKIGMVSNIETIRMIASKLREYAPKNIVIDPVMVSTSGCALMHPDAMDTLISVLLPLGDVITPNLPEAEKLCGFEIKSTDDMERAARLIGMNLSGSVLIKGGHLTETADDLLYDNGEFIWYRGERIDNPNTHGTGCTLSSAIASNLALGNDMRTSIGNAKNYITGALKSGLDLGHGSGPLDHCWAL